MSKVYLYDTDRNEYYVSQDVVVLNPFMMDNLTTRHAEDIEKGYGKIIIDPISLSGSFVYKDLHIRVDEQNNPFEIPVTEVNSYDDVIKVRLKDYREAKNKDKDKYIVKFFDNEFHVFPIDPVKTYDPETNSFSIDRDKFREKLISDISKSEYEIRNHGFYYNVFGDGKSYVQPFREGTPNDSVVFTNLKNELPVQYRQIYLFNLDEKGNRMTAPGTYGIIAMDDVPDIFLQLQIVSIQAYGGYLRPGINKLISNVKMIDDLSKLILISKGYKDIVLKGIADELNKNKMYLELKTQVEMFYKNKPPRIIPSVNFKV